MKTALIKYNAKLAAVRKIMGKFMFVATASLAIVGIVSLVTMVMIYKAPENDPLRSFVVIAATKDGKNIFDAQNEVIKGLYKEAVIHQKEVNLLKQRNNMLSVELTSIKSEPTVYGFLKETFTSMIE